jgi:hypothetical protein
MSDMKAAVIYEPGGPEVLKLERRPLPSPRPGDALIRVKAPAVTFHQRARLARWPRCVYLFRRDIDTLEAVRVDCLLHHAALLCFV